MILLGVHELAERAGVKPRTLSAYLARGQCPAPFVALKCGPIWRLEGVESWLEARAERLRHGRATDLVDSGRS